MKRTAKQNNELHYLIGQLGIDAEHKEELVYQYSNGRTTSSAEMIIPECQALINHLKAATKGYSKVKDPKSDPANVMRRKILSICHEMGWKNEISDQIDWEKLNGWLFQYGYLKKDLNSYTLYELPKLVTQFEQLLRDYYAKK